MVLLLRQERKENASEKKTKNTSPHLSFPAAISARDIGRQRTKARMVSFFSRKKWKQKKSFHVFLEYRSCSRTCRYLLGYRFRKRVLQKLKKIKKKERKRIENMNSADWKRRLILLQTLATFIQSRTGVREII